LFLSIFNCERNLNSVVLIIEANDGDNKTGSLLMLQTITLLPPLASTLQGLRCEEGCVSLGQNEPIRTRKKYKKNKQL